MAVQAGLLIPDDVERYLVDAELAEYHDSVTKKISKSWTDGATLHLAKLGLEMLTKQAAGLKQKIK